MEERYVKLNNIIAQLIKLQYYNSRILMMTMEDRNLKSRKKFKLKNSQITQMIVLNHVK